MTSLLPSSISTTRSNIGLQRFLPAYSAKSTTHADAKWSLTVSNAFIRQCKRNHVHPTLRDILGLVEAKVRSLSKTYIVIDALDECSEDDDLRATFLYEISKLAPYVHLMITSRNTTGIEEVFESYDRVDVRASNEDIRIYIEQQIRSNKWLDRVVNRGGNGSSVREDIISTITERASGM